MLKTSKMGIESKPMLTVNPADELILEGPFNRAVCKKMLVFNPSNKTRVAFKLKTTTPRLFFVRPNVGLVQPMETVGIDIFVHPIYQDSQMQGHKFLMQATEVNVDVSDLHVFWRSVSPSNIWDTKIKVTLLEARVLTDSTGEAALEEKMDLLQRKEPSDPLAMLLKQVNVLEEERQNLLQQVETLHKEKEEQKLFYINQKKSGGRGYLFFLFSLFILIAGVVCAVFGSFHQALNKFN